MTCLYIKYKKARKVAYFPFLYQIIDFRQLEYAKKIPTLYENKDSYRLINR